MPTAQASAAATEPLAPIIIRLPNWIGDVCMCLPSLMALHETGHPLVICGRPWAQALTSQFTPTHFVALSGKFLKDRRAIAHIPRDIRRSAYGLIMPDSLSSAALFAFAGIASCGYRDDGRSLLLRHASRKPDHPVHAVQKWWLLTQFALQQWDLSSPDGVGRQPHPLSGSMPPTLSLAIDEQDRRQAKEALHAHGINDKPFVLLAPTATGLHHGKVKVWPHFGALAAQLRTLGHHVVMCPPPHEREQARATCPEAQMLPSLPLKAFCALTRQAALVVCNDSGVSHLAAAAGAQQLTLFGVTDPRQTGPWSDRAIRLGCLGQWPDLSQVLARVTSFLTADQPSGRPQRNDSG